MLPWKKTKTKQENANTEFGEGKMLEDLYLEIQNLIEHFSSVLLMEKNLFKIFNIVFFTLFQLDSDLMMFFLPIICLILPLADFHFKAHNFVMGISKIRF